MIRDIFFNYHLSLNPYEMSIGMIKFWYEPLIPMLIDLQTQSKENKKKRKK